MSSKFKSVAQNDELDLLVQHYRSILQSGWIGSRSLKLRFNDELNMLGFELTPKEFNSIWGGRVMRPERVPELLAIQQVYRASGVGQISLFHGDVFQLPSDQWICSAFQGVISPSGGAWHGFWEAAGRAGQPWPVHDHPPISSIDRDHQIALLDVNPKKRGGLPTLVIFGRGSRRFINAQVNGPSSDWVEEVYFDTLCLCRKLARTHQLGIRVASPLLFSTLHDVPFKDAIRLQRDFALDLLRQETSVQEVMISVYDQDQVDQLLEAWHLASGDHHVTHIDLVPEWIRNGISALSHELRELCLKPQSLDPYLIETLITLLKRLDSRSIFINDLAVMARNIVEKWAQQCCQKAGLKDDQTLATMVSQLRGRSGSPNRSIQYLDALRELGNVGAHFHVAPHPLEPVDILTILTGLIAMMTLNAELNHT